MLGTTYRWYVAAFSSGLLNIPTHVDQVLDGRVVQTHCASSSGRPNSIQGRNSGTCYTYWAPMTILNRLLASGLGSRMPLARLPLHHKYRQARLLWCRERVDWRVEWRSVVFNDESRLAVCMRVMDIHVYGVDPMSVIFRTTFAHDTLAPPQAS